jgi:hypothetical protein
VIAPQAETHRAEPKTTTAQCTRHKVVDIQDDAAAAVADGARTAALDRLASLGGKGRHKNNLERDLTRLLSKGIPGVPQLCLEPFYVETPLEKEDDVGNSVVNHPLFLPHEILHCLGAHDVIPLTMFGPDGPGGVRDYWNQVRGHEWAQQHPCMEYGDEELDHFIPVGLHGDDVATTKLGKVLVLSVNSLLSRADSLISRLLITVVTCSTLVPDITLRVIFSVVAWSMRFALLGFFPVTDFKGQPWPAGSKRALVAGRPLAGRWRWAYCEIRGDLKFHKETFRFVRNYNRVACCERCRATKRPVFLRVDGRRVNVLFSDFRNDPEWARTELTHSEFLAEHPLPGRSPLCSIPGFHLATVRGDVMHIVLLGISLWAVASCLLELCRERAFGDIPFTAMLRKAYADFKTFIRSVGAACSQPVFTPSKLGVERLTENTHYPTFKGKAWNTRCVVAWLADFCGRAADCEHAQVRSVCLWALADWLWTLEQHGRQLPREAADRLYLHGCVVLQTYSWLTRAAQQRGLLLWPLKPKHHRFHHILRDLRLELYNARFYCCYADEDFCGRVKKIALRVHKKRVAAGVLSRYKVMLGLMWLEAREGTLSRARLRRVWGVRYSQHPAQRRESTA